MEVTITKSISRVGGWVSHRDNNFYNILIIWYHLLPMIFYHMTSQKYFMTSYFWSHSKLSFFSLYHSSNFHYMGRCVGDTICRTTNSWFALFRSCFGLASSRCWYQLCNPSDRARSLKILCICQKVILYLSECDFVFGRGFFCLAESDYSNI